jgi:starch synthase
MKVAFVASEAVPYAKTGGLADVIGALPRYLKTLGIQTKIFLPRYRDIQGTFLRNLQIEMQRVYTVKVFTEDNFYFIDYPPFFDRDDMYGTKGADFNDNCERFTLFCKAVSRLMNKHDYDIVHCHDWQSALVPLYIKLNKIKTKSIFTIHNLGYQGKFPRSKFPLLGIDEKYLNHNGIKFSKEINFLKAGIVFSDFVTTVSETYAREIQTRKLGFKLNNILKKRHNHLYGIINGLDYDLWNPQSDDMIYYPYHDFTGKMKNKVSLAHECNINVKRPFIGMVSRIAGQKGFDILTKVVDEIVNMGFNFILLGTGEEQYCSKLKTLSQVYGTCVSVNIKFDNKLAHRIYAGCDFFLMPSLYEPCGLGQLISLKYGTVPIVRKTGGLADTIKEFDPDTQAGNGFLFTEYSSKELMQAISRAHRVYCNRDLFKTLSQTCMEYNFSWGESAKKYKKLYQTLLQS